MTSVCPECGGEQLIYMGPLDMSGPDGAVICEAFQCMECGHVFDDYCIEGELDEIGMEIEAEVVE